jgi:inosose dehydratase
MSQSSEIIVGNAPVSWGVYEAQALPGQPANPAWTSVIDAIRSAGYAATELGPYGYLPTEKGALADALVSRGLRLGSSFCAVALEDPSKRASAVEHCLKVAALLSSQGVSHLIVADDEDPRRTEIAGRVRADGAQGWSDSQWQSAGRTLNAIGEAVQQRFGMSVVVHHHAGTYIETPAEIARMLAETNAQNVGLLIDTGHATYGGGDACALLEQHGDRVRYVHYKDVTKDGLELVRLTQISMQDAWKKGVFCALGTGAVDFARFTRMLRDRKYRGLVIVEQDVVPDAQGRLVPDPFECAKASRRFLRDTLGLA